MFVKWKFCTELAMITVIFLLNRLAEKDGQALISDKVCMYVGQHSAAHC